MPRSGLALRARLLVQRISLISLGTEDAWTRVQRTATVSRMPRSPAAYRKLASHVLAERGIAAVWQLHLDAVAAHLAGFPGAAALLLAIADAAEDLVWWQTQVTEAARGDP